MTPGNMNNPDSEESHIGTGMAGAAAVSGEAEELRDMARQILSPKSRARVLINYAADAIEERDDFKTRLDTAPSFQFGNLTI